MPGGPALYTACQARALGASVHLVTRLTPGYDRRVFAGITVTEVPAAAAPRYANTYDADGARVQLLSHPGEPLDTLPLPPGTFDAVILAPAYHELDYLDREALAGALSPRVTGIELQGLLRATGAGGRVVPAPGPLPAVRRLVRPGDLAFLSVEDTADPEGFSRELAACGLIVALTLGDHGATVYHGSEERVWAALPSRPIDPTGAGDAFAAAFTVRYAETSDIDAATRFALAAGAVAVERSGPTDMPDRDAIEARMREAPA